MKSTWRSKSLLFLSFALFAGCSFFSHAKADTIASTTFGYIGSGPGLSTSTLSTASMGGSSDLLQYKAYNVSNGSSCYAVPYAEIFSDGTYSTVIASTSMGSYPPGQSTMTSTLPMTLSFPGTYYVGILNSDQCGAGQSDINPDSELDVIGSSTPVIGSISFLFPMNGTTTAPFTNYILHAGGFQSLPYAELDIYTAMGTSTFTGQYAASALNAQNAIQTPQASNLFIPQNGATSTLNHAFAEVTNGLSGSDNIVYASTSVISFTVTNSPIFLQTGGGLSYLSPLAPSSTSITCNSGNVIGDGFCLFAVGALTPQTAATSYLQGSVSAFQAAPPFNQIFGLFNQVQGSLATAPAGADLDVPLDLGSSSGTITLIGSSTMTQGLTSSGKTTLFGLEDAMFSLLDLGLIFFVPWHWWRRKHEHPMTNVK